MSAFYTNNAGARFGGRLGLDYDVLTNGFQVYGSIPQYGSRFNRSNVHDLDLLAAYGINNQCGYRNQNNLGQWGWNAQNDFNNFRTNGNLLDAHYLDAYNNNRQWGYDNQNGFQTQYDDLDNLNHWQRRQLVKGIARRALVNGNRSFDDIYLPRRNIVDQIEIEDALRRNTVGGSHRSFDDLDLLRVQNRFRQNGFNGSRFGLGINNVDEYDVLDLLQIQNRLRRNALNGSRFGLGVGVNNINEDDLVNIRNQYPDLDDLEIRKLINQARFNNILNRGRFGIEEELRYLQAQRQGLYGRRDLADSLDNSTANAWDLEDQLRARQTFQTGLGHIHPEDLALQRQLLNITNRNRDRRLRHQALNLNNQAFGYGSDYETADELDSARQYRRGQWQNQTQNFGGAYDDAEYDDFNITRVGRNRRFRNPQIQLEHKLSQLYRASRAAKGLGVSVIRVADVIEDAVEEVFDVLDNNVRRRFADFQ